MKSRDLIAGVVAGVGVAPSAVINVAPNLAHAFESPQAFGVAVFQVGIASALGLAPFGIKHLEGWANKAGAWVLVAVLLGLSFLNALDLANKARELTAGVPRGTIESAARLNSRIAELRKSRSEVPPFKVTSAASAAQAQDAAKEAVNARDKELRQGRR